jgi:thymidylate kinase
VYCRLDQATRLERMRSRGLAEDVIEQTSNFDKIAEAFDRMAADEPDRFVVVNAAQPIEAVAADVAQGLSALLG